MLLLLLLLQPLLLFLFLTQTFFGRSLQTRLFFGLGLGFRLRPFLLGLPLGRLRAIKRHFAAQALLFENAGLHGLHSTAFLFESPERQVIAERRNVGRQSRRSKRAVIIQPHRRLGPRNRFGAGIEQEIEIAVHRRSRKIDRCIGRQRYRIDPRTQILEMKRAAIQRERQGHIA